MFHEKYACTYVISIYTYGVSIGIYITFFNLCVWSELTYVWMWCQCAVVRPWEYKILLRKWLPSCCTSHILFLVKIYLSEKKNLFFLFFQKNIIQVHLFYIGNTRTATYMFWEHYNFSRVFFHNIKTYRIQLHQLPRIFFTQFYPRSPLI